MKIRVMDISDYEEVYGLWMSSKNMGFNNLDDSKEGIEIFLQRNPNTSFVAVEDKAIIGVVLSGHDGRRGYIYHMFVKEPFRKQKVGTYNEAGSRCWEKQGFVVREDIDYRNLELTELVRIDT